ncbi:MAG TPA: hypothetical protein VE991_09355, partial [Acidimicrobiales bacterium]|nr:hypothetical protein [Acidimicrobiales bacterium]
MATSRRLLRSGVTTALVLLLGVTGSFVAFVLSNASLRHENALLLRQDVVQGSLLLGSFIGQTPSDVSELGTFAPTTAGNGAWTGAARAAADHNAYSGLALLRVDGSRLTVVASVGVLHRSFGTGTDAALVAAIGAGDTPYAASVPTSSGRWLGTLIGPPVTPNGYALYDESKLSSTPYSLSSLPGHPFSSIEAAVYVGAEEPQNLVLTTTTHLPLRGDRAVTVISAKSPLQSSSAASSSRVGSLVNPGNYILVERATAPLSGRSSALLPWVLLGGGLLASVLVAGLLLVSERRRTHALEVVALLEERNHALDDAVAHQQRTDARFAAMVRSSSDLTTVVDAGG